MDPITLTLILAGLSTAGSLGATFMNNQSVRDTNEQNINNQWDMWHATNQYNTPHEQMLRYAEAGLNPNLIYGQSNTTSPVNVGNAQAPDFSGLNNLLPTVMNALTSRSNIRNIDATTELNKANAAIKLMESNFTQQSIEAQLAKTGAETSNLKKQSAQIEQNIKLAVQQFELGEVDKAIKLMEKELTSLNLEYDKIQYGDGFPPDLDPKTRAFMGAMGALLKWITNGKYDIKTINNLTFNTNQD